jgi:hypothetical protein
MVGLANINVNTLWTEYFPVLAPGKYQIERFFILFLPIRKQRASSRKSFSKY